MDEKDGFCLSHVTETSPEPKPRSQEQVQLLHLWLPSKEVLLRFPDHPQNRDHRTDPGLGAPGSRGPTQEQKLHTTVLLLLMYQ